MTQDAGMDTYVAAGIGVAVMTITALGGQLTRYGRTLPGDLVAPMAAKYGYATIRRLERTGTAVFPADLGYDVSSGETAEVPASPVPDQAYPPTSG